MRRTTFNKALLLKIVDIANKTESARTRNFCNKVIAAKFEGALLFFDHGVSKDNRRVDTETSTWLNTRPLIFEFNLNRF